jgi:hypothetical protein
MVTEVRRGVLNEGGTALPVAFTPLELARWLTETAARRIRPLQPLQQENGWRDWLTTTPAET